MSERDFYNNYLMGYKVTDTVAFSGPTGLPTKKTTKAQKSFVKDYTKQGYQIGYDPAGTLMNAFKMSPGAPGLTMNKSHNYFAGFAGQVGTRETDAAAIRGLLERGESSFNVNKMSGAMKGVDGTMDGYFTGKGVKTYSDSVAFQAMIASKSTGAFDIRKKHGVSTKQDSIGFVSEFIAAKNLELNIEEGQADLNRVLQRKARTEKNMAGFKTSSTFATMAQVGRHRDALKGL